MKKLKIEQERKSNRKGVLIMIGVFFFVAVVGLLRVIIANRFVEESTKLRRLAIQQDQLEKENGVLNEQLTENSSLVSLSDRAKNLGFVPLTTAKYILPPMPIAQLP